MLKAYFQIILTVVVSLSSFKAFSLDLKKYTNTPKLTVVIVVDQFRADYLTRFVNDFLPPEQNKKTGGYRFLMQQGAYFPFADYYGVMNNMTCPGHAMILTGSYASKNGIILNERYDYSKGKELYCVEDEKYFLSPNQLKASTVGDELKLISPTSRVISLALKDRAAIMLGGHAADLAFWFDRKENKWVTSSFYNRNNNQEWLNQLNQSVKIPVKTKDNFFSQNKSVEVTIDAAIYALKHLKLGQGKQSDMLAFSISTHDALGHKVGPEAPEMKDLTLAEDVQLARLFNEIKNELGSLNNVQIVLTADHGIQPSTKVAEGLGLKAGVLDLKNWSQQIENDLHKKFKLSSSEKLIGMTKSMHIFVDEKLVHKLNLNLSEIEIFIKNQLLGKEGVHQVIAKSEWMNGKTQNLSGKMKEQFENSFNPILSGNVILIPDPYYREKDDEYVNHMTGYNYDSRVPLIFVGAHIKPGVYANAKVIDLAPTLSFILGVLPPTSTEGRVLSEIFE